MDFTPSLLLAAPNKLVERVAVGLLVDSPDKYIRLERHEKARRAEGKANLFMVGGRLR